MGIDLHTHSSYSDGSDSPADLFEQAARLRISALALTDHDTLDGIPEARAASGATGVELIPGTELSLDFDKGGMHLIVLWLEPGQGPLQDRLSGLDAARSERNAKIVDRLNEIGVEMDLDEVLAQGGHGTIGRPHIATVMMQRGHVESMEQAFDEYLGIGRPAYVSRDRLSPQEAIPRGRGATRAVPYSSQA